MTKYRTLESVIRQVHARDRSNDTYKTLESTIREAATAKTSVPLKTDSKEAKEDSQKTTGNKPVKLGVKTPIDLEPTTTDVNTKEKKKQSQVYENQSERDGNVQGDAEGPDHVETGSGEIQLPETNDPVEEGYLNVSVGGSVYDRFGDRRPGVRRLGYKFKRSKPKPGNAEPADDTYSHSEKPSPTDKKARLGEESVNEAEFIPGIDKLSKHEHVKDWWRKYKKTKDEINNPDKDDEKKKTNESIETTPYKQGYDSWMEHLRGKEKNRPSNPHKPGQGMDAWERGAEDAYNHHVDFHQKGLSNSGSSRVNANHHRKVLKKIFKMNPKKTNESWISNNRNLEYDKHLETQAEKDLVKKHLKYDKKYHDLELQGKGDTKQGKAEYRKSMSIEKKIDRLSEGNFENKMKKNIFIIRKGMKSGARGNAAKRHGRELMRTAEKWPDKDLHEDYHSRDNRLSVEMIKLKMCQRQELAKVSDPEAKRLLLAKHRHEVEALRDKLVNNKISSNTIREEIGKNLDKKFRSLVKSPEREMSDAEWGSDREAIEKAEKRYNAHDKFKDNMIAHGSPAIRHLKTGQVVRGRRGETHQMIAARTDTPEGKHWERGFYHPKFKRYFRDKEMEGVDSTDMMTSGQHLNLSNDIMHNARQWNKNKGEYK